MWGHLITQMDPSVGHLNGILARVGGNLKNNFQKSQMHVWLLGGGGGRLKLQFDRYIIPTALRSSILHKLYAAHGGPDFTFGHARNTVFWPGLTPQVKDIHTNYPTCAQHIQQHPREPLQPYPVPTLPWQPVSQDLFKLNG